MSEIKYGTLDLYGAEHSKCNRVMTLGFKRLSVLKKANIELCRHHLRTKLQLYVKFQLRAFCSF